MQDLQEMKSETDMRSPAVAGRFYPSDPGPLMRQVEECLSRGHAGWRPPGSVPRAVISPHAGYAFSGWLTGAAWRATARGRPETIVILSPSHRHAFQGVALPSQAGFAMPGFEVSVDRDAAKSLIEAGLAHIEDAAHDQEHGIETQLPFMHRLHPGAKVVPLVIGRVDPGRVPAIVDHLNKRLQRPPTFVLSSDLSHFLSRDAAGSHDLETAKLIETGKPVALTPAHACGAQAVAGFLSSRTGQGMRVQRLAMANSAEVTGDDDRTVGYGAWAFFDTTDEIIVPKLREELLSAARKSLESRLKRGKTPEVRDGSFAQALRGHGAAFVTLQKQGRLRGCIGSLAAHQPLIRDVVENSVKSGFHDPRFKPVESAEIEELSIKIAVLSPSAPMSFGDEKEFLNQLVPGRDGLIISDQGKRGVFLPMVWESLPEPKAFLEGLKVKAGLPKGHWSETVKIERFCAESFAEER